MISTSISTYFQENVALALLLAGEEELKEEKWIYNDTDRMEVAINQSDSLSFILTSHMVMV